VAGANRLYLGKVFVGGHWGKRPAVQIFTPRGDRFVPFFLLPQRPHRLSDGTLLRLEGMRQVPLLIVRARHAPGNPWALLASLLLVLGCLLMGRRWVQP
jgi:hypothetical protein